MDQDFGTAIESPGSSRRWILSTVVLCLFGFFKEVRPSENFLTEYLIGPHQNLTLEEVNSAVYPVWTYAYLAFLVPVFLLTDLVKYKPVIILEGLAYITTWSLLLWAEGLLAMQMAQLVYGLATATEIAYYSYIYSVVDEQHFQMVTSLTRGCALFGRFVSGALGQLLVSYVAIDYYSLNYVSMACVCLAFVLSLLLPSAPQKPKVEDTETGSNDSYLPGPGILLPSSTASSLPYLTASEGLPYLTSSEGLPYLPAPERQTTFETPQAPTAGSDLTSFEYSFYSFGAEHRSNIVDNQPPEDSSPQQYVDREPSPNSPKRISPKYRIIRLWVNFKECYSNRGLLRWSVWWAIATCGNFQVGNYIQNLWEHIQPSEGDPSVGVYNGAVEAAATLGGAVVAFLLIIPKINWKMFGEVLIGCVSLADGAMLIVMAFTSSIWTAYALYDIFRLSYQMVVTIATCQIAFYLGANKSYAMVFGCNTFLALLLQTLMTVIVVDQSALALPITTQFLVNGSYYLVMGTLFVIIAFAHIYRLGCRRWWSLRRIPSYETLP